MSCYLNGLGRVGLKHGGHLEDNRNQEFNHLQPDVF